MAEAEHSQVALEWDSPHRLVLKSRQTSELPGEGMVRVRITSVGVCGTDLAIWAGKRQTCAPGTVLGHEFGGEVEAVGPGTPGSAIGDIVAVDPNVGCDACHECSSGRRARCAERRLLGLDLDGGFQTSIDVAERQLIPVPLGDPRALGLVEPLAVGIHAVRRAGLQAGSVVGIIGAGPIGMACAVFAQQLGAQVVFRENDPLRQHTVRELGFVINADGPWESRGFHVVLDTVGAGATIRLAIDSVADGGTVCVVGMADIAEIETVSPIIRRELRLVGSFCYDHDDLMLAAEIVSERGLSAIPAELTTGLSNVSEVFQRISAGNPGVGKSLLVPEPVS